MNPHGYTSRMTVGNLIEVISGKAAALQGIFKDGTVFGPNRVNDIGKILIHHGYAYDGIIARKNCFKGIIY